MIPKLLEVHELAAGLVATVCASASDCMKSWPLNERHAQAIFTEASEKWRGKDLHLQRSRVIENSQKRQVSNGMPRSR